MVVCSGSIVCIHILQGEMNEMAISAKDGKLLYHLTHLDNLASILEWGLRPRSSLKEDFFKDTADQGIIAGRSLYEEDLARYVPFHFFARNPYDGAVCKNFGSENMAIIAIWRPQKPFEGYYIIPNHPLSGKPEFLPYQDGFEKIRWDLIDTRDYLNDETKQMCMAECDVDHPIAPQDFAFIYVKTEEAGEIVRRLCGNGPLAKRVQVSPYMFP